MTVHHLGTSQSERIVWLCEELELDYDFRRYERRSDNNLAPDDYRALHPSATAPIITDDGFSLGESGAICDYIVARYGGGRLAPAPESPEFPAHLFWFHYANGTFMATAMMDLSLRLSGVTTYPAFVTERIDRMWRLAEDRLGEAEYFGGKTLTTADIMMGFPLTSMRAFANTPLESRPNIRGYLARIAERPAYRRAMAKAEPGRPLRID